MEKSIPENTHNAIVFAMQQQRDNAMNDVVNARAELILLRQENAELKKQLDNVVPLKEKEKK